MNINMSWSFVLINNRLEMNTTKPMLTLIYLFAMKWKSLEKSTGTVKNSYNYMLWQLKHIFSCSYESNIGKDPEKEKMKPRFSQTIKFVEEYLCHVVDQDFSFVDKKQNKLTYEVCVTIGMQEK